ncbi:MAG TPA: DUF2264 domain-containing protein [Bryobacteraceae bacterium]|nr:DUF2264 domain-containing protein [Bryobacteraceae bacterium]
MDRREFLAASAGSALVHSQTGASLAAIVDNTFLEVARGFVRNAAKTSSSYAVVEHPAATVTRSFLAKSGKSVTGVTRMLPAMAAWIVGKRQPGILHVEGKQFDLLDVTGSAIVNGTNPDHEDYWGASPTGAQDQRQVESSLVAWSAWRLRDTLLPQMTTVERRRLDEWLASCTRYPVRRNNWAWFTAVNIAARMALKDRFEEFSFDQNFMFDDLRALDAMYTGEGWYNDDKPNNAFDYYNHWVFASHFLYWNAMVGARFPDWSQAFAGRLKPLLESSPFFFGANGSHVLYGRSLIYRFAVLTPLVLAYMQKLWPLDAGLLARIVRGSLQYHAGLDGLDSVAGKLRETYSGQGTLDIQESYIDGGHPYWAMQAFALSAIPREDPLWTASTSPLPVERTGFAQPLTAPGLLLLGHRQSGQVKLLQAKSTKTGPQYRDKYNKLVYSTHFPFCIVQRPDVCPWDNALVLRNSRRRHSAGRGPVQTARVTADGVELAYSIEYGGLKVQVRTTLTTDGEMEGRVHRLVVPQDVDPAMELAEGGSALGLASHADADHTATETFSLVRNRRSGMLVGAWIAAGWSGIGAAPDFGPAETGRSNIIWPQMQVNTLWTKLKPGTQILTSVHYASPKPLSQAELHAAAAKMKARLGVQAAPSPSPAKAKRRR